MNTRRSLSKQRHDRRIHRLRPRQLHGVGEFVRRNALQHQLPRICILSLVPLQRHGPQPEPDRRKKDNHRYESGIGEIFASS